MVEARSGHSARAAGRTVLIAGGWDPDYKPFPAPKFSILSRTDLVTTGDMTEAPADKVRRFVFGREPITGFADTVGPPDSIEYGDPNADCDTVDNSNGEYHSD